MQRAHSVVTIKSVDAETRTIRGLASSPAPDRVGDIVEPSGAQFKLPLPLLWQHKHDEPIGEVTAARVASDGVWISAKLAAEGVSARIDEAWALVKAGLVRGLSIGFRALEQDPLPSGGWRFKAWEMIELSAVTVPANAACTIDTIKALDAGLPSRDVKAVQAQDLSDLPRFPRSLSKADRSLLASGAADQWSGDVLAKASQAGVKFSATETLLLKSLAGLMVQQRWAAERIEELERKQ